MKTDSFFNLVPKGVKIAAAIIFGLALLAGPMIGMWQGYADGVHTSRGVAPVGLATTIGLGMGLLIGAFFVVWLLCLGYVYADARRRAMPAVLWVLIAIFIPNLLGFLLYFALRRPLGSPCPSCGQSISAEQRFCAWCGSQSFTPPAAPGNFPSPGSGASPIANV